MQPFSQTETAYSATALNVVFSAGDRVDTTKVFNPERKAANFAVAMANIYLYRRMMSR